MGAYLDTPIKEKHSDWGGTQIAWWGATGMQGWRCNMEDAHIANKIVCHDGKDGLLFGVFDGHGGE